MKAKYLISGAGVFSILAASLGSAYGQHMLNYEAKHACREAAKAKHPDLQGKAFGEEVKKCKADPAAYTK